MEIGSVLTGKVTSITRFGAFVSLGDGRSGLVHISEIADTYVENIKDHLSEGQEVSVRLMSIDDAGRLNLSIKRAAEKKPARMAARKEAVPAPVQAARAADPQDSFEDRLSKFMKDSKKNIEGSRHFGEKKSRRRR